MGHFKFILIVVLKDCNSGLFHRFAQRTCAKCSVLYMQNSLLKTASSMSGMLRQNLQKASMREQINFLLKALNCDFFFLQNRYSLFKILIRAALKL